MSLKIISVATGIYKGYTYLQNLSENGSLSEVRRQNNNCLHILVKSGWFGEDFHDKAGGREITKNRGIYFSAVDGRIFYHPDPTFSPNGKVEWLIRSEWKQGGLNPEYNSFPVVSAASMGYAGFWWRSLSGDKGGGNTSIASCRLCAKESKELAS